MSTSGANPHASIRPSNFSFLGVRPEWASIEAEARRCEDNAYPDPRVTQFYARRVLESIVGWLYTVEARLSVPPGQADNLNGRLTEPAFRALVPQAVQDRMHQVRKETNRDVHRNAAVDPRRVLQTVVALWQVCHWLATIYAPSPDARPAPQAHFDPSLFPKPAQAPTLEQESSSARIKELEAKLEAAERAKAAAEVAQREAAARDAALIVEHARAIEAKQAEVAAAKAANQRIPDTHDYTEDATREFIDTYLAEAGWGIGEAKGQPGTGTVRLEVPVAGLSSADGFPTGTGYADYVLYAPDGSPLAVIEAKRASRTAEAGRRQAELYATALERIHGVRPVSYYSNGHEHWLWEEPLYAPRRVGGFHSPVDLARMLKRHRGARTLTAQSADATIAGRDYQQRAIASVADAFQNQRRRKALLVMATGTGKTRTTIALAKLLAEARWAKRILFLADRTALVNQAAHAFNHNYPSLTQAVIGRSSSQDVDTARLHLGTYPAVLNAVNATTSGTQRAGGSPHLGVGHYDLIVVDEAHRSIYSRYRALFDYFDGLLVGLTATPREDVDHDTYGLFELADNAPTFAYELSDAIREGYLVPPRTFEVPLRYPSRGVRYADLGDQERLEWDTKDWTDWAPDGDSPDEVSAGDVNRFLFNNDTVDKVVATLMEHGHHVDNGDRLGKTIIFARNQNHAEFIQQRIDLTYPQFAGHLARVITHASGDRAQGLIDAFASPAPDPRHKRPDIAISVDMLDTGIDVPEVVNLVFFKPVHSRTKFWQMIGRGTRLRPDLFGPGRDKTDFLVFDVCGNLEYFNTHLDRGDARASQPLAARTFATRVRLLAALRAVSSVPSVPDAAVASGLEAHLAAQVGRLPATNIAVRPHLETVRRYAAGSAWAHMDEVESGRVESTLSALASLALDEGDDAARHLDFVVLSVELAVASGQPGPAESNGAVLGQLVGLLADLHVPLVDARRDLIDSVVRFSDWASADLTWLETVRVGLRPLMVLADAGSRRKPVFTDVQDTFDGEVREVSLEGLIRPAFDVSGYRIRARAALESHLDHLSVIKLRQGRALTAAEQEDLQALLLVDSTPEELAAAAGDDLRGFVLKLVGLDAASVQEAFDAFVAAGTGRGPFGKVQLDFIDLIKRSLLDPDGTVSVAALYESPFSDAAPNGPEDLFDEEHLDNLVDLVERFGPSKAA
ncbi:MAG: DEAD/DEAH box helicase family protein [Galactobacter sp.]